MKEPEITIETIAGMKSIYIRYKGTYLEFRKKSRRLFSTLFDYAKLHDLLIPGETRVMTLYHDNPFITDEKNLRTSVAMSVPAGLEVVDSDEIGILIISGKFAVGHFELASGEYPEAWKYMYQWLFSSTKKARDSFPFEMYITDPPRNFKDRSFTDIYIPIE